MSQVNDKQPTAAEHAEALYRACVQLHNTVTPSDLNLLVCSSNCTAGEIQRLKPEVDKLQVARSKAKDAIENYRKFAGKENKPCPFCLTPVRDTLIKGAVWLTCCHKCGAEGPAASNADAAMELWNARPVSSRQPPPPEKPVESPSPTAQDIERDRNAIAKGHDYRGDGKAPGACKCTWNSVTYGGLCPWHGTVGVLIQNPDSVEAQQNSRITRLMEALAPFAKTGGMVTRGSPTADEHWMDTEDRIQPMRSDLCASVGDYRKAFKAYHEGS